MALRDQPYLPLYVQDYLTDEKLSCCSYATQGIYIRIMCILHKSENYGGILFKQIPKQNFSSRQYFDFIISRQTGIDLQNVTEAVDELLLFDVLKITQKEGVDFLYQKRMVTDFDVSNKRSESAKKGGGNPNLKRKNLFKQNSKQIPEYENEYENEIKNDLKRGVTGERETIQTEMPEHEKQKLILPQMAKVWQDEKPEDSADPSHDNPALLEIARFICTQAKTNFNPADEKIKHTIIEKWKPIAKKAAKDEWHGNSLKQVANHIQTIISKKNGHQLTTLEQRGKGTGRSIEFDRP